MPARLGRWSNNLRFLTQLPHQVIQLATLLRQRDIDLVHVNASANIVPVLAAVLARRPLLWHWNDLLVPTWLGMLLKLLALASTAHIAATGTQVEQKYQLGKVGVRYLGLLPPPLPPGDIREIVKETALELPRGRPLVGFVGNLLEKKGALQFIETVGLLKQQGTPVTGVMIGGTPSGQEAFYRQMLRRIGQLGLEEDIHLIGYRHDVPALMLQMDALLFPSHTESAGIVVLEALSAGVPLAATPVGHVRELLEGLSMPIVPIGDVPAMAKAVQYLLEMTDTSREIYREAARRRIVKGYSIEEIAARHETLYDAIMVPRLFGTPPSFNETI